MNWMTIEKIQIELRVRGELDSPGILARGTYRIIIPNCEETLVTVEESLLNNSTGQRVVCIECDQTGFGLEAHLASILKCDDSSILFQPAGVRLPHAIESRMRVRSVRKSVTLSGRSNCSEFPSRGTPALFISGVKAAKLKLFDQRNLNNINTCVATEPPDVDALCIFAIEQKKECVIRFET